MCRNFVPSNKEPHAVATMWRQFAMKIKINYERVIKNTFRDERAGGEH